MPEQPDVIGRYEIEARIAHGGQGTLYRAYDRRLQRHVAIKLLREPDDEDLRTRFAREARAVASLNHPNIVTVFEVGEYDGQPFMAMEYIDGQTLTSIIDTYPLPSTVRRLDLMEALCNGLAFAHKLDVIHRDIKPANLMVRADGRLKIVDFGIARAAADSNLTQAGRLVGTVNYMSPEQVRGADLDGRSDMFAVGAVFYELMCGRQAFPGPTATVVLPKILDDEPEPLERICPGLDPGISRIVLKALEKDPARRFVDLLEMGEEIAKVRESIDEAGASVIVAPLDVDTVPPSARRRGTDLGEIAQRRTQQIDASLKRAQEALAEGRHDEAIAQCEEVLVLDPANSLAHAVADRARLERDETRAREYLSRAGDELRRGELTAAAQSVRDALTLLPDAPDALELARVIREARVAREREAQQDEEARRTAEMAQRLFDEGDHAEALAVLETFSPAHPIVSRLWVSLSAAASIPAAPAVPAGVEPGGGARPLAAPGAVDRATEPARAPAGRSMRLAAAAMIALAVGLGAFWVWRAGTSGGATPAAPEVPTVPIARAGERAGRGITPAAQSPAAPRDPRLGREAGPAGTASAPVSPAPDRAAVTAGRGGAPADPNTADALPLPLPSTTGPSSGATGTVVLPAASSPVEAKVPPGGDREVRRDDSRAPKAEIPDVEPLVPEKTAAVAPQVAPAVVVRAAPAPPGTDEDRIRRALAAYTQALGARDVNGVLHVFPNANRAELTQTFVDVLEFTMEIDVLQVRVAGNAATVAARVRQWIRKVRDQRRGTERQLEFQMQRAGDDWIISAIRPR